MKLKEYEKLSSYLDDVECKLTAIFSAESNEIPFFYSFSEEDEFSFSVLFGENIQEFVQNLLIVKNEHENIDINDVPEDFFNDDSELTVKEMKAAWRKYIVDFNEVYSDLCKIRDSEDYRISFAYVEKVIDFKTRKAAEEYAKEVIDNGGKIVNDIYENNSESDYPYSIVVKVQYHSFETGW